MEAEGPKLERASNYKDADLGLDKTAAWQERALVRAFALPLQWSFKAGNEATVISLSHSVRREG